MKRFHLRSASSLVIVGAGAFAACSAEAPTHEEDVQSTSDAVAGAVYTTFDATQGGCLHGSGNGINCNHYRFKQDVYVSGGPVKAGLSDGDYYFAVLVPGSQNGGFDDGADGNLSDDYDAEADRTFRVENHEIVDNLGSHPDGETPNGKWAIQLYPYADTTNPGGVYILAVCEVNATSPRQCKYDAFKVEEGDAPYCGDGEINGSEDCDGTDLGECEYGCTSECTCEPPPPPPPCCGDDEINGDEECDGTDLGDCEYGCTSECTCEPPPPPPPCCGDDEINGDEECDGTDLGDCEYGCTSECTCEPPPECVDPRTACDPEAINACGEGYVCDPNDCECVCAPQAPDYE